MEISLHPDLKILKAALLRLDFNKYLNSQRFRLLFLEHDFDEAFKQALSSYSGWNRERYTDAFLHVLNWLLNQWINIDPNSQKGRDLQDKFRTWLFISIIDYYSWKQAKIDLDPLFNAFHKVKILNDSDVVYLKENLKATAIENTDISNDSEEKDIDKFVNSVEYAIITALEEDEMEKALPLFERMSEVQETNHFIELGIIKSNPDKKVVYASQHTTGMVDAAILATELVSRFKPKFLIMIGVLGGKPEDTAIGDVVIATKVFEIDRGKVTDVGFKKETSASPITSREIKKIQRVKKNIEQYIKNEDPTRNSDVKLHFGPIACVNQVIDVEGFFESSISAVDRKAIALEMESFAITRACQLVNDGRTMPIIIKSVMDNTSGKTDANKTYAAWTSAKTLEYLLNHNII